MNLQLSTIKNLYEKDYYLWLKTTLSQLQKKDLAGLDWEHLIEEIEVLGNEQKHKVESYLRQLLIDLLLISYWERERSVCSRGWKVEIRNFRDELELRLQSKTLDNYLLAQFDKIYTKARKTAIDKTGLPSETFPIKCPFTWEQVLDSEYFPE